MDKQSEKFVDSATNTVEDTANSAFTAIKDKAEKTKTTLKEAATQADEYTQNVRKQGTDIVASFGDSVSSVADAVAADIRKYPVESALVAFGLGVIGTFFLHRKR